MRQCKQCPYVGEKETFPEAGRVKGVQYYRHLCTNCYTAQKRDRTHKLREFLDSIKKEAQCLKCGNNDWRVIEWHHEDPATKSFALADASRLGYSIERIQAELDKCVPLCANCHRIVEWEAKQSTGGA